MPISVTTLTTIRDNLLSNIAQETVNPKPSYTVTGKDGSRTVDWNAWYKLMMDEVIRLNRLIIAQSPYWIQTRVTV